MVQGQANRGGWANGPVTLFHGTTDTAAASIMSGIDLRQCALGREFGVGFYTTTSLGQAEGWAQKQAARSRSSRVQPAVVRFTLDRDRLATLDALWFVRGGPNAGDFWAFVRHCRGGGAHRSAASGLWYDVVVGPVTTGVAFQRTVYSDYDQVSFHTKAAVSLLDRSSPARVL